MQILLQVGVKSVLAGAAGQLTLFFGNKAAAPLERVVCAVPPAPQFALQLGPVPGRIEAKKQIQARDQTTSVGPGRLK